MRVRSASSAMLLMSFEFVILGLGLDRWLGLGSWAWDLGHLLP